MPVAILSYFADPGNHFVSAEKSELRSTNSLPPVTIHRLCKALHS
jgi:hypothetical protein